MTDVDVREYAGAVARYGLPGTGPPPPLDADAWPLALATLREEKIIGIAMAAADAGWLPIEREQYEHLADRHRAAMVWCLSLERRLLDIAEAFDSEGIEFIVLKGPALAHTVYPDPSWRMFTDLDLLVETSEWRSACGVLMNGFGWPRRLPEPRPGFDVRFGKAAVFTTENGQQIDLHRNLAQGPFGICINSETLVRTASSFVVGGRPLRRLNDAGLFLHACVHAVLGDERPSALQLRDISATALSCQIDENLMREWQQEWRLTSVVAHAASIVTAWQKDALPCHLTFLGTGHLSKTERRMLDAHLAARRRLLPLATLRAIPRFKDRMAYLAARIFPDRAFVRARTSRSGINGYVSRILSYVIWLGRSTWLVRRGVIKPDSTRARQTEVSR